MANITASHMYLAQSSHSVYEPLENIVVITISSVEGQGFPPPSPLPSRPGSWCEGLYLNDSAKQLVIQVKSLVTQFYQEGCVSCRCSCEKTERPIYSTEACLPATTFSSPRVKYSQSLTLPLPGAGWRQGWGGGRLQGLKTGRDERRRQAFPDARLRLTGWEKERIFAIITWTLCVHQTLVILGDGL